MTNYDRHMDEAIFGINRFLTAADDLQDQFHICANARYRHPWPLDRNCPGCVRELEKHVARSHLEMAYRLWGWDAMIESFERAIQAKIDQRDARRMLGAYI